MSATSKFLSVTFALATALLLVVVNANAVTIKEVTSEKGIKALFVEDYTLPIISMSFSFQGGTVQDPDGKDGVVRLMAALLDEGAGDMDSQTFRAVLEDRGIELGFSANRESVTGGVRSVVSESGEAFDMLRLALVEPRFDQDALERLRNATLLSLARGETNPSTVARNELRKLTFADHPYGRASRGEETTVKSITREDIKSAHARLIAKDQLYVGVVGAISAEDLAKVLDQVFGPLPETADLKEIAEVVPAFGKRQSIDMPVPNASISLVYPGVKRKSEDFFAAYLMNHILGGGSFSSRLYTEVREKRGLVYGVSSGLVTLDHTAFLVAGTSTRASNQDETISVIKNEITRMAQQGVTEEELSAAKRYVSGSYAINNLDTSTKIARVLVAIQSGDLGIDYIDRRRDLIDAVTLEDVNRLARQLLSKQPTVVTVGSLSQ